MGSRRLAARSVRAALALAWLALCLIPCVETKVSRSGQPPPAARCPIGQRRRRRSRGPPLPGASPHPAPAPTLACRWCGRTRARSWLKH